MLFRKRLWGPQLLFKSIPALLQGPERRQLLLLQLIHQLFVAHFLDVFTYTTGIILVLDLPFVIGY